MPQGEEARECPKCGGWMYKTCYAPYQVWVCGECGYKTKAK